MKSIKLRLGIGILLSISAVFILLWLAGSHSIRLLVVEQMSTRLMHDSEGLLAHLTFDTAGQILLDPSGIDSIYQRPFSGHYYIIHSGTVRLRSRSLWDSDLALPSEQSLQTRQLHVQGPQQQPLLVLQTIYLKQGNTITIAVAEDLTMLEQQISRFHYWFGLVALAVLALLVLLQVFIVRVGLSPLYRARQQITELEAGKRNALDYDVPTELQPLVHEINKLVSRITQRLQRSRNALGDLAHALKKPLTVLAQLNQDECLHNCNDIRKQMEYQTSDIQRSIDHVLKRARLAGEGPPISQFSLQHDLPALLDTLARMYPQKEIASSLAVDDHERVPFDREDMMELLGNIIDNACKWARHKVLLDVDISDSVHIRVQDDGPGIDEHNLRQLTARGTRLDEKTSGHGLGLAIAEDIVRQYSGSLSFTSTRQFDNGLCVDIHLPLRHDSDNSGTE